MVPQDVQHGFALVGEPFVRLVQLPHDVQHRPALLVALVQPMLNSAICRCNAAFARRRSAVPAIPGRDVRGRHRRAGFGDHCACLVDFELLQLLFHFFKFLLEGDHLEFPADDDLFELFEVEDLFLQFGFRSFQVADNPFIGPHVVQHADRPDDVPVRVAQGGGVQRGGDDFARRTAGIQAGVAGHAPFHHFPQRRGELAGFLGADEPRQRLLDDFVRPKAQQRVDRVVRLQDLPSRSLTNTGSGAFLIRLSA